MLHILADGRLTVSSTQAQPPCRRSSSTLFETKDGVTFLGFKEWPEQRYEAKRFSRVPMDGAHAISRLREIQTNTDKELAHMDADGVLCDLLKSLGYASVVDEYHKVDKWFA